MRDDITLRQFAETISDPTRESSIDSSAALAGSIAAALIAGVCGGALDSCKCEKAEEELTGIRDRALSLRKDLLALVEHGVQAQEAVAASRRAARDGALGEMERLRALLFASEVPLRTAESCHALLNLSLRALGRAGVKHIAEIGTAAAMAFAGVVGGIVAARSVLARIPSGSGIGAEVTRKRAERIFREAEAIRTQIIDRVRQHLP
jgi:formiminotetrahydrofolate cyclodeaminase